MLKYWVGDPCRKTALYGQYSDHDHSYAGPQADRTINQGRLFPVSLRGFHFEEKPSTTGAAEKPPADGPHQPPV